MSADYDGSVDLQGFDEEGVDTDGNSFSSIKEVWTLKDLQEKWYTAADKYWKEVSSDVDGMLGGFAHVSKEDVRASKEFLKEIFDGKLGIPVKPGRVIDCGAGIGRVSKLLLVPLFEQVDILEQNPNFVQNAKDYIASDKVKNYFCAGLQDFSFDNNQYDVIWIQWVSSHLTDKDFVTFMKKCQSALKPSGIIVVKENTSRGFCVDKTDYSITRSDDHFKALFKVSGLELLKVKLQTKFPKELFPVRMYALK